MTAIPVEQAKRIAESYGASRVVIWAFDAAYGQHVATWGGPSLRESLFAAEAGNAIKLAAGWPGEAARALPASFLSLFQDLDAALAEKAADGLLDQGTVLAVFLALREVVRARDAELAEQLVPRKVEAAIAGGQA